MTATLTAPVEALLREQVAKSHFPSLDRALEVAVKAVDGLRASYAFESLLDEALSHPGKRVSLARLRRENDVRENDFRRQLSDRWHLRSLPTQFVERSPDWVLPPRMACISMRHS